MSDDKKFLTSLDELAGVDDTQYLELDVPEWKTTLRLGSLNAEDMIEWSESADGPAKRTMGLRLIIRSLVNEKGERIGTDKQLQILKRRDAGVCTRIVAEIVKLNKLNAKGLDDAKNGLGEAPAGSSPTVLH